MAPILCKQLIVADEMRLSQVLRLTVTCGRLASKSENILVKCYSLATGYRVDRIRPRLDDKLEFMGWDPLIEQDVLYREQKKIRSIEAKYPIENYPTHYMARTDKTELWHRLYNDDKETMARVDAAKAKKDDMLEKWGKKKSKKKPRNRKV